MGRKTFEAIGRVLPGRTSVVITRQSRYEVPGAVVVGSLDEALQVAAGEAEVFVIGGEQIYRLALPTAQRIYLTLVHAQLAGDAVFPVLDLNSWTVTEESRHLADEQNHYNCTFQVLDHRSCLSHGPHA
jgi:dihydrofolate reductase